MMFAGKRLVFRLELNGRLVHEIRSDEVKSDITIGRSGENVWSVPAEDRSASSRHAKIIFKNKTYYIQDCGSRNGVYFHGQRIQEKKLTAGDLFSIGDCKLIVEQAVAETTSRGEDQFHKFEQLSGANKGRIYRLTDANIKIGSSSGCTIVLDDSLISNVHAVIENHTDGTCWVKDMKSRNGTKVNGSLLTDENAETGRMLKDGDIVSMAYIDFRFWDKNVTHIRSHLFLKIGVIAATLAIAIGGYIAFQAVSPSAKKIRLEAEKYAAQGKFDAARDILQSAVSARGAEADAEQRLELIRKLKLWQHTWKSWNNIRQLLSGNPGDGDLYEANDLFASLISGDRECWQWNASNASAEMKNAQETQQLLSVLLGAEDWMSKSEDDVEYLKNLVEKLTAVVEVCSKNPQSYQTALFARARDLIGEMRLEIKEYEDSLNVMADYKSGADTDRIIQQLEQIRQVCGKRLEERKKAGKISSLSVYVWCGKLLAPLNKLRNSQKLLDANYTYAAKFDFAKYVENIALPDSDECIVSANLSLRRAEMEKSNLRLKKLIAQLKNFRIYFSNNNLAPVVKSSLLEHIFTDKVWSDVLACDCLNLPQPSYSDKQSRSVYDRTLGVYVFWEYLRSIGSEFDTTIFEERFKPDLFRSQEIFNHLAVFVDFCNPSVHLPFYTDIKRLKAVDAGSNQLMKHLNIALEILNKRDELIKKMYEMYQRYPDRRDGIIAGSVALYLNPERKSLLPGDLAEKLNKSLKLLRKELSEIVQQSGDAAPEQVLRNEKRMLELGIPGDSFLKQPWTDHIKRK